MLQWITFSWCTLKISKTFSWYCRRTRPDSFSNLETSSKIEQGMSSLFNVIWERVINLKNELYWATTAALSKKIKIEVMKMVLNAQKQKNVCVHFCSKRKSHDDPCLHSDGNKIKLVKEVKFLGVIFYCKLSLYHILRCWKKNDQKI